MENAKELSKNSTMIKKLSSIKLTGDYKVELTFSDGTSGVMDFSKHVGKGIFQRWLDKKNFEKVHIGEDGQLEWDEDIDFCPDALYLEITGKKPEELFPNLTPQHA